jgi:RNA polymerase II subunit A-like phosphatase
MVVAIDDRADVWHWSPNLIKVRPYNFFLGIGDINEPLKEDGQDIPVGDTAPIISMTLVQPDQPSIPSKPKPRPILADNDTDLLHLSKALITLHKQFYTPSRSKPDIRSILPSLKTPILAGCNLVFSGIIPLGIDPSKSDIWILATQFGARCDLEINSPTTHLIAKKVICG